MSELSVSQIDTCKKAYAMAYAAKELVINK
jgi:hypothetical protein